jgi:hypothetical protein
MYRIASREPRTVPAIEAALRWRLESGAIQDALLALQHVAVREVEQTPLPGGA